MLVLVVEHAPIACIMSPIPLPRNGRFFICKMLDAEFVEGNNFDVVAIYGMPCE